MKLNDEMKRRNKTKRKRTKRKRTKRKRTKRKQKRIKPSKGGGLWEYFYTNEELEGDELGEVASEKRKFVEDNYFPTGLSLKGKLGFELEFNNILGFLFDDGTKKFSKLLKTKDIGYVEYTLQNDIIYITEGGVQITLKISISGDMSDTDRDIYTKKECDKFREMMVGKGIAMDEIDGDSNCAVDESCAIVASDASDNEKTECQYAPNMAEFLCLTSPPSVFTFNDFIGIVKKFRTSVAELLRNRLGESHEQGMSRTTGGIWAIPTTTENIYFAFFIRNEFKDDQNVITPHNLDVITNSQLQTTIDVNVINISTIFDTLYLISKPMTSPLNIFDLAKTYVEEVEHKLTPEHPRLHGEPYKNYTGGDREIYTIDSRIIQYVCILACVAGVILTPDLMDYEKSEMWFVIRHDFDEVLKSIGITEAYINLNKLAATQIIMDFIKLIRDEDEIREVEIDKRNDIYTLINKLVLGKLCTYLSVKKLPINNGDGTQTIKSELRFIKNDPALYVPFAERGEYNYNK
jgi:hypothetical protein